MPVDHRQQLQHGYILHARPYRDTSKLLEVFTAQHGRIGLVARGVRASRNKQAVQLEPFVPLLLSWSGHGELHTLTGVEPVGRSCILSGKRIISGFYVNELLLRLLQRQDPHPELFGYYEQTLQQLAVRDSIEEILLREFEKLLLEELGYGLQLHQDAESGEAINSKLLYCYYPELGPVQVTAQQQDYPLVTGATLQAINSGQYGDAQVMREAKLLMRYLLSRHLDNRPLKSRELFWQMHNL